MEPTSLAAFAFLIVFAATMRRKRVPGGETAEDRKNRRIANEIQRGRNGHDH